jgi:Ca2+-binding EF-hand superfamily protein
VRNALIISIAVLLTSGQALAHGHGKGPMRFERLDTDGNGRLSKSEWVERSIRLFDELDENRDQKVLRAEAEAHCERRKADRFVSLDANSDGKLSRGEVRTMSDEKFGKLDANGDGYLTQDEFQRRRCRHAEHAFAHMDSNDDGVITKAEAREASLARFAKIDKDGDGYITRDEFRSMVTKHRRGKMKKGGDHRGPRTGERGGPSR